MIVILASGLTPAITLAGAASAATASTRTALLAGQVRSYSGTAAPAASPGHDFGKFAAASYLSCTRPAKITGTFTLDVAGIKASFAKWTTKDKGKQFRASLGWSTTISAAVNVNAKTTCTPGKALKKIAATFVIDGIKVSLHPDFKLTIHASGDITASQTTSQSVTISGKLGLALPAVTHAINPGKPAVTASGSAVFDALIGAQADITAGVLGLDFQLMAGIHATAKAQSSPTGVCVKGYPELYTGGTIAVTLWDWHKTFLDKLWPITSIAGHPTTFSLCSYTPPVITTTTLPAATTDKPYTTKLTTADHRTGTWKITAGKLPPGLALSGYTISGTPDTAGTYKFTLSFTDTHAHTVTAAGSLTVADAKWAYSELPLPANAGGSTEPGMYGVSCPAASFCVAVGSYSDTSDTGDGMLLTRSDGSWAAAEAPVPSDAAGAALSAVSCPSAQFCVAVGHFAETSGGQHPLLLTWAGGSWTAAAAPLPADSASPAYASLDAVSCPSASFCTAVGYYDGATGQNPLLLTWAGGSWTAAAAPLPADSASPADGSLDAVSCPSASFCVAGGNYTGNDTASLMLTWSDGSWTATRPFTGHQGWLNGVSCPSASFCTAVGDYLVPTTTWAYQPEVLTWSGSAWAAAPGPIPSGAVDVTWGSVSCPSSSYCAATGLVNYDPSSYEWQDLVRTWWGGSWTESSFPQSPSLVDASCWSAGDCVVIGTTGPGGGTPIALTSSN